MEDVKKKEKDKKQKLDDMKLKSLLQLRDSLMATASLYMMGVDNCKASFAEDVDQVTDFSSSLYPYILDTLFLCRQPVSLSPVLVSKNFNSSNSRTERTSLIMRQRSRSCRLS